jgi:ribosomal protein S18 acetylase RimI-like enzyme
MGGVRLLDPGTAELKRMWVSSRSRGLGYGRALLNALEAEATKLGARRVVLDTAGPLTQAIALYRSSGFVEVQPYNDNPDCTLWFGKPLADGKREPRDPLNSRRTRELA